MSLHPTYARPASLDQATALLSGLGSGVMVIAGGQELMPHLNHGQLQPSVIVDITGLPDLKGIREDGDRISLGALTVHRELQTHPLVRAQLPLLAFAATRAGGGRQVHNRGTLGGNLVAMHPLYDIAPSLLVLGAEVEIATAQGLRRTLLSALLKDTRHGLGSETLLTRVLVPPMPVKAGYAYEKLKLSSGAYGSANAAAWAMLEDGKLSAAGLVLGAASDALIDATSALSSFLGRSWSDDVAAHVAAACSALVTTPLDDHQGPGPWRAAMAGVVARRAMAAAVAMAANKE